MKINKFKLTIEFQVSIPNRFSIKERDINGIRVKAASDIRDQLIEASDRNEIAAYQAHHIISEIKQTHERRTKNCIKKSNHSK